MAFVGMDPERIRRVAEQLRQNSHQLTMVNEAVQRLINQAAQAWEGQDTVDFSDAWSGQHRLTLQQCAQQLDQMSSDAVEQIAQQETTSGIIPGGPGSALPPGAVPPGTKPSGPGSPTGPDGDGDEPYEDPEQADGTVREKFRGKYKHDDYGHDFDHDGDDPQHRADDRTDTKDGYTERGKPGLDVKLHEGEASAELAGGEVEGTHKAGDVDLSGKAEYHVGEAKADYHAGLTEDGLAVGGSAGLVAVGAKASGKATLGVAEVGGSAEASVEASVSGDASIGKDGLHAGVEAFAGARARADLSASVAGVGGTAGVEGWAGVGAEADVTVGKGPDGKFHIGGELGAGLGLGGKVDFDVTVDPGAVVDAVGDAGGAVLDAGSDAVDAVADSKYAPWNW